MFYTEGNLLLLLQDFCIFWRHWLLKHFGLEYKRTSMELGLQVCLVCFRWFYLVLRWFYRVFRWIYFLTAKTETFSEQAAKHPGPCVSCLGPCPFLCLCLPCPCLFLLLLQPFHLRSGLGELLLSQKMNKGTAQTRKRFQTTVQFNTHHISDMINCSATYQRLYKGMFFGGFKDV